MKELEKTKRISIASTLFILIVIIAVLSFERPKHMYKVNSKTTLEKLVNTDYFVSLSDMNNPDYILIDVRNRFEFEKGHLENSLNIYTSEILNDHNSDIFKKLKEENKTAVLYGTNPNDANAPFIILSQLGYDNIKILCIENSYVENKLISKDINIVNSKVDIKEFIAQSIKDANKSSKQKAIAIRKPPKKVITIKKKKKAPAEGGC